MSSLPAQKYYEKGIQLIRSGKLAEAEDALANAIALDEQQAEYWVKLGLIWAKQGRHAEARDASQMAATLQPGNSDALYNLGLANIHLGAIDDGMGWIEKAFALKPSKDMAITLGDIFYGQENYRLASYYYMKARQVDKNDADVQFKLAGALYRENDTVGSIILHVDLVGRFPKNHTYISSLVDIYRRFDHTTFDESVYKVLLICLKAENVKHRNLGPAWSSLILLNPALKPLRDLGAMQTDTAALNGIASLLEDEFLNIGLQSLPVLNIDLEKTLTEIRRFFLNDWRNAAQWPKEALTFLCSLAIQGWYNDFVFFETDDEKRELAALTASLQDIVAAAEEKGVTEAILFALYACYRPLYTVKTAGVKLPLAKGILYEMRALLKAQAANPEAEAELMKTIPDFTEITDDVSQAVQAMYAQRPYPRWKSASKGALHPSVAEVSRGLNILVAGCGTGQETALFGNSAPHAHITAVDLSLPSIAYAKRMAGELGYLPKIDFMHGDLIDVGKIGRKFDLVVSSGVLHHMKEPEKGWAAILDTLKPGGRMSISLYSKIARDHTLGPASAYIVEKGYSSSDDDIRKFRRDVMDMPDGDPVRYCVRASDFYMLSECNDLLFHIQEHRMTFPVLKEMTARLGLEMFHIYMPPASLKAWDEKYPGVKEFDFDRLHEFEQEHPDTFLEMYKMYFRRKGDHSEHEIDQLIRLNIF